MSHNFFWLRKLSRSAPPSAAGAAGGERGRARTALRGVSLPPSGGVCRQRGSAGWEVRRRQVERSFRGGPRRAERRQAWAARACVAHRARRLLVPPGQGPSTLPERVRGGSRGPTQEGGCGAVEGRGNPAPRRAAAEEASRQDVREAAPSLPRERPKERRDPPAAPADNGRESKMGDRHREISANKQL